VVVIATQLLMQLPCFLAILMHLWLVASECKIGEGSVVAIATQLPYAASLLLGYPAASLARNF